MVDWVGGGGSGVFLLLFLFFFVVVWCVGWFVCGFVWLGLFVLKSPSPVWC